MIKVRPFFSANNPFVPRNNQAVIKNFISFNDLTRKRQNFQTLSEVTKKSKTVQQIYIQKDLKLEARTLPEQLPQGSKKAS